MTATPSPPSAGHDGNGEPRPVADIDQDLFDQLQPLHRIRWIGLLGFVLLMAAAVTVLVLLYSSDHATLRSEQQLASRQAATLTAQAAQLNRENRAIKAACLFWTAVIPVPVAPTPPAAQPSKVLVVFIAGARAAYVGDGCGPPLPPPSAALVHWAQVFKVPVQS